MTYLTIFHRLIIRPLRSEPARTLLTALAVALGVAVVLAIEMAGEAAAGSFRSSMETLTGKADFEVTADGGIPPETWTALARLPYALKLRPRIEDYAVVSGAGRTIPFIGIDVLSDTSVDETVERPKEPFQTGDIWAGRQLGWKVNDRVPLLINDRVADYTVRGLLPDSAGEVVVVDLSVAARLLGRTSLDRILVETPAGKSAAEWENIIRPILAPGVNLASFGAHTEQNRRMLAAFRWNLRILSYIALVVGAFLIYNTISVSVVRRRAEIGMLRALGATRSGILIAFLGEAACFGLIGGVLGALLGRLLASGAVGLVAATVESLYVSSRPGAIALTPGIAGVGLLAGLAVAIVSALGPAWEASRVPPVEAMQRGRREHLVRVNARWNLALAGVLSLAAFAASRQGPVGGKPVFGYLAALLMIGALAAGIPSLVATFSAAASSGMRRVFGVEGLLATRSLSGSLRRTSVLAGALATAIAMTAAVGIMVGSFRETVLQWMNDRLQADLYIRPAGPARADRHPTMSAEIPARLRALPQVEAVDTFRAYEISFRGLPATLGGSETRIEAKRTSRGFVSGARADEVFHRLGSEDNTVIISEAFANKHSLHAGGVIRLPLGGRKASFRILDVYYDYANERGYIVMDRRTLLRYLPDPAPSNVAVYLKAGIDLDQGRKAVEGAVAGRKLLVLSNRSLRNEAIRTFDRTFAITYALEAVAVLVAVMGMAGALLALVIDRRREFGLLRFLGGATGQIRRLILFEAGVLGFLASLAGLALGFVLSLLLIFVINKQSFGWTIQFHLPVAVLLGALSLVFCATVLSSLYPARVAMRLNPIEVIHED